MNQYNEFNNIYKHPFSYDKFDIFKKNMDYIDEFNQQNHSYKLEINQFADMNNFSISSFVAPYVFKGDTALSVPIQTTFSTF